MGLEAVGDKSFLKTYHALLDIFRKHEEHLDNNFVFAKYDPQTLDAYTGSWGNRQNDAIGLFLFKIGDLIIKGHPIIRDEKDREIVQKLIDYLEKIEYWNCRDNGVWEEDEEVHASSVGACVAGLKEIKGIFKVPNHLIREGQKTLEELLPKESETKKVDLALLNLIYPFNITNGCTKQILKNVEKMLVRKNGAIRYHGDQYFNEGGEAQWTMAFPWLALIYKKLGNKKKYQYYMRKAQEVRTGRGHIPELYFHDSGEVDYYNDNTPLGWAHSLSLIAQTQN
jgi:GH15 family glucan-1,4-alpha-glucosidase